MRVSTAGVDEVGVVTPNDPLDPVPPADVPPARPKSLENPELPLPRALPIPYSLVSVYMEDPDMPIPPLTPRSACAC